MQYLRRYSIMCGSFSARFEDVTAFQKTAFFVALMASAASAVCLIAVPATHRLRFQQRDRPFIVGTGNGYVIASLVLLGLGIVAALVCLTDYLYGGAATVVWPGIILVLLIALWFARPLLRNRSSDA
jgi:hypothetical protein